VLTAVSDLAIGSTLRSADLALLLVASTPDGALRSTSDAVGQLLASPVRRGEILTDVRLLHWGRPEPGPGRVAVPVQPADPATVDLLAPGAHVAVLVVSQTGQATVLASDAVVLVIAPPSKSDPAKRLVVLAVPMAVADRTTAASVLGTIALRFAPG